MSVVAGIFCLSLIASLRSDIGLPIGWALISFKCAAGQETGNANDHQTSHDSNFFNFIR